MTVHGRGYKYVGPTPVPAGGEAPVTPKPDSKPVVVVLPFENLCGDPNQLYFSDGITQDIIDRLTRFRMLSVIGHDSAFALRDTRPSEVRSRIAADYVLTGNVRRAGDHIRLAARLTDAKTGSASWAEHYDRPLVDIFAVQDEVAAVIASTLMGRVELDVGSRSPAVQNRNLSSYELVLQGMWHFRQMTLDGTAEATRCFERAIEAHPGNAEAHRYLALCYMSLWWNDFVPEGPPKAVSTATRGVELDPLSANCHRALGVCRLWAEGTEAAAKPYATALELNPGDPTVLLEVGLLKTYCGEIDIAHDFIGRAFRLNPLPPPWYSEFRGVLDFVEGRYAEALGAFEAFSDLAFDNMYVLACLGHLGEIGRVRELRSRLAVTGRHWDFMAGAAREPYRDPEPHKRLTEGLQKVLAS